MRTLLVDDDPAFRRLSSLALTAAGVEHDAVTSAAAARERIGNGRSCGYDLVLLDQEMPGMSGEELLKELRQQGLDIPIVLVTVHDTPSFRVRALQLGADDYVAKPFSFEELLARLRAVIRRSRGNRPIRLGALEIDPLLRCVRLDGQVVALTTREFEVLWVLVKAEERTVTRKELLHRVWSMNFEPGTNFIQVHVSRLRDKLEPVLGSAIQTIRGQGYRLALCPQSKEASPARERSPAAERATSGERVRLTPSAGTGAAGSRPPARRRAARRASP